MERAQVHLVSLPEDERLILPNLQYLQGIFGYIHPEAVPLIASELNVSVADVHGVLTFYHELKSSPPAPVTLAICVAEACQASGSRALVRHLEGSIAPMGARSEDGQIEIVEVFCLGNCALGPAALINSQLVGRLTPANIQPRIERALSQVSG